MSKKADRKKQQDQKRHDQEKRREEKQHEATPPSSTESQPVEPSTVTTQPAAPTPPTETSDWWRRLSVVWTNLGGVGLLGLIVAVIGILYTHHQAEINSKALKELQRQNDLTERNQKRLTGEIAAKMQLAEVKPEREDFGDGMKIKAFGKPDVPYFKNVEAFLRLPPIIRLNNIGEEPIEAVRLVTTCADVALDPDKGVQGKNTLLLRQEERQEIVLAQQWLPGTAIEISLVKVILAQMAQVQMKQPPDVLHQGFFHTRIYGKITGSTVYGNSEGKMVATLIHWLPSGFADKKCRDVYDNYRHRIHFGPKLPVTITDGEELVKRARREGILK